MSSLWPPRVMRSSQSVLHLGPRVTVAGSGEAVLLPYTAACRRYWTRSSTCRPSASRASGQGWARAPAVFERWSEPGIAYADLRVAGIGWLADAVEAVPLKLEYGHTCLAHGEDARSIRHRFIRAGEQLATQATEHAGRVIL